MEVIKETIKASIIGCIKWVINLEESTKSVGLDTSTSGSVSKTPRCSKPKKFEYYESGSNTKSSSVLQTPVTRQRVTEQAFCGCVICVNAIIAYQGFRADLAAPFIDESGGFYLFWEKVSAGCAWDAWKGCYLAVWDGIAGKWRRE